jgi:iron(III) transport system substrate-binding protein
VERGAVYKEVTVRRLHSARRGIRAGLLHTLGALAVVLAAPALAQQQLPAKFADDPVAKALGAEVFNAALKEGKVVWYGATTTQDFYNKGGQERFEKRFGIKLELINGRLRTLTDRLNTESAVKKVQGDVFLGNDQYMIELHRNDILEKWRPPAPELDRMKKDAFVQKPEGYWWPVQISAQALLVNTKMVPEGAITSYRDLLDPKWQGKVVMRDPRALDGGGAQMLGIYVEPSLGLDYLKQLVAVTKPVIIHGGTQATRDAVIRGQFAIGFSGRGEFFLDLPKGAPLAFVVPKEGLTWGPSSIAMLKAAPHPNAAKLLMSWFYELPQLQLWGSVARGVPHPDVLPPIPQMSVTDYPLMARIPDEMLENYDPFFKQMEQVFGIR